MQYTWKLQETTEPILYKLKSEPQYELVLFASLWRDNDIVIQHRKKNQRQTKKKELYPADSY